MEAKIRRKFAPGKARSSSAWISDTDLQHGQRCFKEGSIHCPRHFQAPVALFAAGPSGLVLNPHPLPPATPPHGQNPGGSKWKRCSNIRSGTTESWDSKIISCR